MTTHTHANQANQLAGVTRVRAFASCPVSPAVATWSPITLGTGMGHKYGRPRRLEVSHP